MLRSTGDLPKTCSRENTEADDQNHEATRTAWRTHGDLELVEADTAGEGVHVECGAQRKGIRSVADGRTRARFKAKSGRVGERRRGRRQTWPACASLARESPSSRHDHVPVTVTLFAASASAARRDVPFRGDCACGERDGGPYPRGLLLRPLRSPRHLVISVMSLVIPIVLQLMWRLSDPS